jgi:DNA-binding PadR family transcriptional regulator
MIFYLYYVILLIEKGVCDMPHKGSTVTEIVILALLKARPQHGYEIRKHTASILRQPELNTNLLYPALHRLERSRAIEKRVLEQKGRPTKHVYRITTVGAARFAQLLQQFGEVDAEDEDEFLVRVAFFQFLDRSSRMQVLALRKLERQNALAHWRTLPADYAGEFVSPWIEEIGRFRERQLEQEIEWIEELEAIASQPSPRSTGAKGRRP